MLTRNIVLLLSLFVLMVLGDLDSNDAGMGTISTDKDSTSDEAPTESMNAISLNQPDEHLHHRRGPSDTGSSSSETAEGPAANLVTAELAVAAASSVEENNEEENSDSEEVGRKRFSSRSAKPQQSQAHLIQNSAHIQQGPALSDLGPALFPLPIIPQPKTQARSRMSKRRSRTNRRQI